MKIGIMTWHEFYNYGTALQLFGLSYVLKKNGNIATVINYHTRSRGECGEFESFIKKVERKIEARKYVSYQPKERSNRFRDFLDKNINYTNSADTLPELERLNEKFDAFICGSDQIWSPNNFDPHFYLDFVSDDNKKIAYAPSIGLTEIKNKYVKKQMAKLISKIPHLSVRELSGSQIIFNLTGRKAQSVLDPTLLLDCKEWQETYEHKTYEGNDYLLVYMLGHNEKYWKIINKIALELNLEVKIIPVFYADLKRKGCISEPIGPTEFLCLIENSSFVCTDSFHGTLFAVQYHKEFCTFERFKKNSDINQNSRIYNILYMLNLRDRIISDSEKMKSMLAKKISWETVESRLEEKRQESLDYLNKAINDVLNYRGMDIKNNVKKDLTICCGCGACMAVCSANAIDILMDNEGFYVSSIDDEKCISCGKCRNVCPYLVSLQGRVCSNGILYYFKSNSHDILMGSSSGGAAFELGLKALEKGFDVVGCSFDREKQIANHIIVKDKSELTRTQGSKYIQSDFSKIFQSSKNRNDLMIFGTPCQIAAARNLYNDSKNVYIDLICHGVPSYYLYKCYRDYLKRKYKMNTEKMKIEFRYKPRGWNERYIFTTDNIVSVCNHQNRDPFFLNFEHGVCYSKGCYECPWRDRSQADIRIGDYWNPRFKNDKTGISMMIALTEKGKHWVDNIRKNGRLEETDINDYTLYQQLTNISAPLFREEIIEKLASGVKIESLTKEYVMPLQRRKIRAKYKEFLKKQIKR